MRSFYAREMVSAAICARENCERKTNRMTASDFCDTDITALVSHLYQTKGTAQFVEYKNHAARMLAKDVFASVLADLKSKTPLHEKRFQRRFKTVGKERFTFIDLFAGIGGFRIAMQNIGGRCVFSSEWNPEAQKTYCHNFGELPFGDITKESTKAMIPRGFDVLCAGFPCQAFSVAGYRRGFEDTRGTLFFDVAKIISMRRPKAFFLENVKNLKTHDCGKTYQKIRRVLTEDLGYAVFDNVMSPDEFANLPQNRERVFIVGFDPRKVAKSRIERFAFPGRCPCTKKIADCIDYSVDEPEFFYDERYGCYGKIKSGVKRKDTVYQWRRQYVRENKSNQCPTLTANMGAGGHNVPLILTDAGVRKLTPRECLNFQGFPPKYEFADIAMSRCYMQAGNSVAVPLIQRVASKMMEIVL